MVAHEDHRRTQAESACRWLVESIFARKRTRRRTDKSGIRATLRDDGPQRDGAGGFQLFGARHRQYGSSRTLWHAGTEGTMALALDFRGEGRVSSLDLAVCNCILM